jgi:NAD(P)-dependent dehydrogenase (short-subunit alcohol dehydrogenase family)
MDQVAVVTGANSGIGRATAVHLAGNGYRVFGTVRATASTDKLRAAADAAGVTVDLVEMDVADDDSTATALGEVLDRAGSVDLLVNNAGVGGNAVVEECPPELVLDVMNVNVCGPLRCIRAVVPSMRERGSGCIVNVSSVAGRVAPIAQAPYAMSKWALEALSEELAQEVAPFGVRVAIVEPGVTRSAIFAKNVDAPNQTGAYDAHYRRMFQFYAAGIENATDPTEVADVILRAATTDEPRLRYPCSWSGVDLVEGRAAIGDEGWVELGRAVDDADYFRRFEAAFGLDIATAT